MSRDLNLELKALQAEVKDMLSGPEEAVETFWQNYAADGNKDAALNEMLALCGPSAFMAALPILFPPYNVPMPDCFDLNLPSLNPDEEGYVQSPEGARTWDELRRLREESKYPVLRDQRDVRYPYRVPTDDVKRYQLISG